MDSFYSKLLPVPKNGGFRMHDYFVWCGSVIKEKENRYHMFASRWPKDTGFPDGYRAYSEIVRAESDTPAGPYTFKEVVIGRREDGYWDSLIAHNPNIVKVNDMYVLYYLGAPSADPSTRRVGYAYSYCITGPWKRIDNPIPLIPDSNNPAACVNPDGSILLAFRYGPLKIGIAKALTFDGEYSVVNSDIMPGTLLEDPYFFYNKDHYEIILEDNQGQLTGKVRYGAHLRSENGVDNWTLNSPAIAYDHDIQWNDGSVSIADRRERPQLLIDESGNVTHLFTGIKLGNDTWNISQPLLR